MRDKFEVEQLQLQVSLHPVGQVKGQGEELGQVKGQGVELDQVKGQG